MGCHFMTLVSFLILSPPSQSQPAIFGRIIPPPGRPVTRIRLMTFNVWNSGGNVNDGLLKIRDQILLVYPDVVALQELQEETLPALLQLLGPNWVGTRRIRDARPDTGLISRHIIDFDSCFETGVALGCRIKIRKSSLWDVFVYSVHLDWSVYGPYTACKFHTSQLPDGPRLANLQELLGTAKFLESFNQADRTPVVILGDFNEPSHLDWTDRERPAHCGQANDWKSTKLLEAFGFRDAFRTIWSDPLEKPGITWSTVVKWGDGVYFDAKELEPQDRIDFIFHKGRRLRVLSCSTFPGSLQLTPVPNHRNNVWPSDHYAVFADYDFDTTFEE